MTMSNFNVIYGLLFLSLGLICDVKAACTNGNGVACSDTECCYDDIPPVLGSGGAIVPGQECYASGERILFTCTGDLKGPPFNDCTNGVWGFPFGPTCEAVTTCPQPTVPTDGSISPDNPNYDLYTRINYSCDDGFSLVGPSEAVCESGGVWNPSTTPTCENVKAACTNGNGVTCADTECCYDDIPPVLGSGGAIHPKKDCYASGERVTFNCTGDLKGPPFNDCNNGDWGFPFGPTCEAATTCPQPIVPTDGSISPDNPNYDLYTRIYYDCDDGYSLVGPSEAVCESGGVWNPSTTPTCESDCDKPSLDNGGVVPDQETFSNKEVLTYQCDTNYTLVGVSTTTCLNGDFDPATLPICYSMCLPPVVDNSDYSSQLPPVDHASTITIECDSGYSTGTGTDKDLTCNNGDFDDTPPVCYANCPPLSPSFDNGVRSGDTTPFYHDEQLSYTCNCGYTLVGSSSITCNDGSWSDNEPVCRETPCPVTYSNNRLECRSDSIRITISQSVLPNLAGDVLRFENDPNCTAVVEGNNLVFTTRFDQCGTTKEVDGDLDVYKNRIVNGANSGAVVSGDITVSFPITCFYERVHHLEYGYSSMGSAGVVQQALVDTGSYSATFDFSMYTDATFTMKVNPMNNNVPVNQRAYFAVEATTAADQRVAIDSCWTTPTNNSHDNIRYNLITDGCTVEQTVMRHDLGMNGLAAFSLSGFTYIDTNEIYLFCTVAICETSDTNGECSPCGSSARRKRGTNSAQMKDLSVGSVYWIKEDMRADIEMAVDVEDEDSAQQAARPWMTAVAVMATVMAAMFVIILVLVRRNLWEEQTTCGSFQLIPSNNT